MQKKLKKIINSYPEFSRETNILNKLIKKNSIKITVQI